MQICQTGLFKSIEEWIRDHRKYGKLHKVTDNSENQEILMLVKQTWDRQFVGHGKDGANLGHSQLQVNQQNVLIKFSFLRSKSEHCIP